MNTHAALVQLYRFRDKGPKVKTDIYVNACSYSGNLVIMIGTEVRNIRICSEKIAI